MGGTREFHGTILCVHLRILNNERKHVPRLLFFDYNYRVDLLISGLRYKSFDKLLQLFLIVQCMTDKYLSS